MHSRKVPQPVRTRADPGARPGTVTCGRCGLARRRGERSASAATDLHGIAGGGPEEVRNLQNLMLRSGSGALVSVRRVTKVNAGRKTAGVDGRVVLAGWEKPIWLRNMALQAMLADCRSLGRPGLICDARCRMATFRTTVERRSDDLYAYPSQAGHPVVSSHLSKHSSVTRNADYPLHWPRMVYLRFETPIICSPSQKSSTRASCPALSALGVSSRRGVTSRKAPTERRKRAAGPGLLDHPAWDPRFRW
jgi:hypothetical protein